MDQLDAKPLINVAIKIEDNMSHQIILCIEHIMTIGFQMHTKETHFNLMTH
jgi:hypothetical protein